MGEPGPTNGNLLPKTPKDLLTYLQHEHPGCQVSSQDGQFIVYTLHGVGATEEEAIINAVTSWKRMKADGRSVTQMLGDIRDDLKFSGMSRERHDRLIDLLNLTRTCLDAGVLTNTVAWITVPSLTRQIDDLIRRVDMRLAMTAAEMIAEDKADKERKQKFPRTHNYEPANPLPGVHTQSPLDALAEMMKRRQS